MLPILFRRLGLLPDHPVVIAPQGEFFPFALGIHRFRKRFYREVFDWQIQSMPGMGLTSTPQFTWRRFRR